jgi:hypothetical protein
MARNYRVRIRDFAEPHTFALRINARRDSAPYGVSDAQGRRFQLTLHGNSTVGLPTAQAVRGKDRA